jgi:hypothetical protein
MGHLKASEETGSCLSQVRHRRGGCEEDPCGLDDSKDPLKVGLSLGPPRARTEGHLLHFRASYNQSGSKPTSS